MKSAFVEGDEIMGAALVLVLRAGILDAGEFHGAAAGQVAPQALLLVERAQAAQDRPRVIDQPAALDGLAAEDDAAAVGSQGEAEQKLALTAPGRAAIPQHIGGGMVGALLRAGQRGPERVLTRFRRR
jgi:hypothetical protein